MRIGLSALPQPVMVCLMMMMVMVKPTHALHCARVASSLTVRRIAQQQASSALLPWQQQQQSARAVTVVPQQQPLGAQNLLSVEECLDLYSSCSSSNDNNHDDDAPTAVRFVDGSWYHKGNRSGRAEFLRGPRIPGSAYFDIDDIACSPLLFSDLNPKGLSHMQPPASLFAALMDACHIRNADHVIVYGGAGCAFLPRIWFTFRHVMGHERVSLMQGSLQDWMAAGGPVDSTTLPSSAAADDDEPPANGVLAPPWAKDLDMNRKPAYQVKHNQAVLLDVEEMKEIVQSKNRGISNNSDDDDDTRIFDARGSSFALGHMPGAIHVPYSTLHEPDNPNRLKPVHELRKLLRTAAAAGAGCIDGEVGGDDSTNTASSSSRHHRTVVSCGSGVSACSLYLALEECGLMTTERTAVYDGSWEEWGSLDNVQKVIPEETTSK